MLRDAARFVDADQAITLNTEPGSGVEADFALGPAAITGPSGRVLPFYAAFEAIEAVKDPIDAGQLGRIYGCFTSMRFQRDTSPDDLEISALLPAIGVTLDLLPGGPSRVFARRASLLAPNDAWFVTLRMDDDAIATIETLAVLDSARGHDRDLRIEVTASEHVLRAEPMRQSVVVEPLGAAQRAYPWWENLAERYLHLLRRRASQPPDGSGPRLRAVWNAIQESVSSGAPVGPS
jgi:predicted dehydrogenase